MLQADSQKSIHDILLTIRELDTGIIFHTTWMKNLHRSLVCNEPPPDDDLKEDAHCRCNFGRWYAGEHHPDVSGHKEFAEIGRLHACMHDAARILLNSNIQGQPMAATDYDKFMDTAIEFKLKVRGFQFSLINKVCAVDHLTGVWNRYAMTFKLSQEHERASRTGQICCLALMDLDHFKQINDKHGHLSGDLVLQSVMQFFTSRLRKHDTVFRFGGEEFLIAMPGTSLQECEATLDRLRQELSQTPMPLNDTDTCFITASFGLAVLDGIMPVESAIQQSDHALLCAKARGRNMVCLWSEIG